MPVRTVARAPKLFITICVEMDGPSTVNPGGGLSCGSPGVPLP